MVVVVLLAGCAKSPSADRTLEHLRMQAEERLLQDARVAFFNDLTTYMASGPVVVLVLEGAGAIKKNRDLMGATDPKKAEAGTIRAVHGASIEANVVHGSDSPETANFEIGYFFPGIDTNS